MCVYSRMHIHTYQIILYTWQSRKKKQDNHVTVLKWIHSLQRLRDRHGGPHLESQPSRGQGRRTKDSWETQWESDSRKKRKRKITLNMQTLQAKAEGVLCSVRFWRGAGSARQSLHLKLNPIPCSLGTVPRLSVLLQPLELVWIHFLNILLSLSSSRISPNLQDLQTR